MKEPESIIYNVSKCLSRGKNQRKAGHSDVGRCDEMPLLWKHSMTSLSVIAEMKTKQFYFLAEGFSATIHRNPAHIIHTVGILRLGQGSQTHRGAFLGGEGLLIDFCVLE